MEKLKNIVIICETAQEEKKALKVLEMYGNKWVSGNKATQYSFFAHWDRKCVLIVCDDATICYDTDVNKYKTGHSDITIKNATVMTANEFAERYNKKQCIVLYRDGSETIALDRSTGKKAVAKCSPDDPYDFFTGAKLAFERLTGNLEKKQPHCECGTVKEVRRKAKAGEYVKIVNAQCSWNGGYKNGDILRIVSVDTLVGFHSYVRYGDGCGQYLYDDEYVVLVGYNPNKRTDPPKPQLYNGSVVCVDVGRNIGCYTVGKVYRFKDGKIINDRGAELPGRHKIKSFKDWAEWTTAKFVELVE